MSTLAQIRFSQLTKMKISLVCKSPFFIELLRRRCFWKSLIVKYLKYYIFQLLGTILLEKTDWEMRSNMLKIHEGVIEAQYRQKETPSKPVRCSYANPMYFQDLVDHRFPLVFELTWYKYKDGDLHSMRAYSDKYVPYYTRILYESKGIAYNGDTFKRYLENATKITNSTNWTRQKEKIYSVWIKSHM